MNTRPRTTMSDDSYTNRSALCGRSNDDLSSPEKANDSLVPHAAPCSDYLSREIFALIPLLVRRDARAATSILHPEIGST